MENKFKPVNSLSDIFNNYSLLSDNDAYKYNDYFIKQLNTISYTTFDILQNLKIAKPFIICQAFNKLLKQDISVLPYINKYKHFVLKTNSIEFSEKDFYCKNRFIRLTEPILFENLINNILGITMVKNISDLLDISKKLSINFVIINNIGCTNVNYTSDKLNNKVVSYNVGICREMFDETNTIVVDNNNYKTNISIKIIPETIIYKNIILLETNDGINYSQLYNVFDNATPVEQEISQAATGGVEAGNLTQYFNISWSELLNARNKILNDKIAKNVMYYYSESKNKYNIDYKSLVDYIMSNITSKDNTDSILKLIIDYIGKNINIHANEIKSLLAIELSKIKYIIEVNVVHLLRSNMPVVEKNILIYNELYKIIKKLNSFNLIYAKEQFINHYKD